MIRATNTNSIYFPANPRLVSRKDLKKFAMTRLAFSIQEICIVHYQDFILWPPGGGACGFPNRDNNILHKASSYYLFGAECLFCLAVVDCVKPDIDQIASIVYCMNENPKDDR